MQDCNVIAKGSYSKFRFNDFVSVRQYLLIREKGRKYLILKLSNDATETVTSLKLVVEQLDVRGACIETSRVEWEVNGKAGEKFVPKDKLALREGCVEVKIHLVGATYGDYTYAVKSNELVVTYGKKQAQEKKDYSAKTSGKTAVSFVRKFKIPRVLVIVSILMLVCAFTATILQLVRFKKEETQFTWKDVRYEFVTDNKDEGAPVRVIGYEGYHNNVTVPKAIEGYPVTQISQTAFNSNNNLYSIKILADVEIEAFAFTGCNNLMSVELTGVTKIGNRAFYNCRSLQSVVANNLEEIASEAFLECGNLQTLEISHAEKVLTIGSKAFENCSNLNKISIQQTVQYPDTIDFFKGVSSLQSLTLKHYNSAEYETKTDKTLANLFNGTTQKSLRELTIEDIDAISTGFCSEANFLETVRLGGFKSNQIPEKAFNECSNLSSLIIEMEEEAEPIDTIGDYALYQTRLESFDCSNLVSIGEFAFACNGILSDVNMDENQTLVKLGKGAFKDCASLKDFAIPATLLLVPESAFENCTALQGITFADGAKVSAIDARAMYGCTSLTYIRLPNSVHYVGASAFENCVSATTLMLSHTVDTIAERAFAGCSSITEIEIPNTATQIGVSAFENCAKLTRLKTPFIGTSATENNYLATLFGGTCYEENYVVPESLQEVSVTGETNLGDGAFYGLKQIKRVYLTGDCESIGASAFWGCVNLRELRLSSALKTIGDGAFSNCYLLFEIWNDSVLNITRGGEEYGGIARNALAVYGTSDKRLEYVEANGFAFLHAEEGWYVTDYVGEESTWVLPESFVAEKGDTVNQYALVAHLFEARQDVQSVTVTSGVRSLGTYTFAECAQLNTLTFRNGVNLDCIEAYCFYNNGALQEVLTDGDVNIKSIEKGAFADCMALKNVTLPETIEIIAPRAFSNCQALETLVLPNCLKSVGEEAFIDCAHLTELTFGEKVERIGYGALAGTGSLSALTVPFIGETAEDNRYMAYLFGRSSDEGYYAENLREIYVRTARDVPEKAFYGFQNVEKIVFLTPVEKVRANAFSQCSSLVEIDVSNEIKTIGESAFAYTALTSITLPEGLIEIGAFAFTFTQIESVTFPDSLEALGQQAFFGSALKTVYINGTLLTDIPDSAFAYCEALHTVDMVNTKIENIGINAFMNTKALDSVTFPKTLRNIGYGAFNSSGIKTVMLTGNALETIGEYCFQNCVNLEIVSVRGTVKEIPNGAFSGCTSLRSVSLSNGIRRISYSAFQNTALKTVTLPTSVETLGAYAFADCASLGVVRLGTSLENIEHEAFANCPVLYEVYNLSGLEIVRGQWENGQVAINAVIVHKSSLARPLQTETVNGLTYKFAPTEKEACLFACDTTPSVLDCQSVQLGGEIYENYWIWKRVFADNEVLEEVNTGVVTELSEYAFGNCINLKRVTLGKALEKDKIWGDAFANCARLWEVHDNNPVYELEVGSYDCGMVAYYAVVINENISYKTVNECEFMYFGNTWYLYECKATNAVVLPDIGEPYELYTHRVTGKYPFQDLSYGEFVVMPKTVTKVHSYAFGYMPITVYYEGTEEEWLQATANAYAYSVQPYFYKECVHNSYEDTFYWRYKDGAPTTEDSELVASCVDATCQAEGEENWSCAVCKNTYITNVLPKVDHSFTGTDGACVWCKETPAKTGDLGKLLTIKNDSDIRFMVDKKGSVYSDWREDYGSFTSVLTLIANVKMELKFDARILPVKGASAEIWVNGKKRCVVEFGETKKIIEALEIGDEVVIKYAYNGESENRLYIENVSVTEIKQPPTGEEEE